MNEQFQSQLSAIIGSIAQTMKASTDFAFSQLPEVVRQYLLYGRVFITTLFVISTVAAVFAVFLFYRIYKRESKREKELELKIEESRLKCIYLEADHRELRKIRDDINTTQRYCLVLFTLSMLSTLMSGKEFLFIWLAPKAWLLQHLIELAK